MWWPATGCSSSMSRMRDSTALSSLPCLKRLTASATACLKRGSSGMLVQATRRCGCCSIGRAARVKLSLATNWQFSGTYRLEGRRVSNGMAPTTTGAAWPAALARANAWRICCASALSSCSPPNAGVSMRSNTPLAERERNSDRYKKVDCSAYANPGKVWFSVVSVATRPLLCCASPMIMFMRIVIISCKGMVNYTGSPPWVNLR